jgi:hypothetical protein
MALATVAIGESAEQRGSDGRERDFEMERKRIVVDSGYGFAWHVAILEQNKNIQSIADRR